MEVLDTRKPTGLAVPNFIHEFMFEMAVELVKVDSYLTSASYVGASFLLSQNEMLWKNS